MSDMSPLVSDTSPLVSDTSPLVSDMSPFIFDTSPLVPLIVLKLLPSFILKVTKFQSVIIEIIYILITTNP